MGGYQLKERWGQFTRDLRQQWVKFREAHLVQDEQYDENAAGQFPRLHADTWGYSETGQRMRAVVSPAAHGEVHAFTELSVGDRDPAGIHRSKNELVLTPRKNTAIGTAPVPGGALLEGAALPLA